MKQQTLRAKREELYQKIIKLHNRPEEVSMFSHLFRVIELQDQEFLRIMKGNLGNCIECGSTITKEEIDNLSGYK